MYPYLTYANQGAIRNQPVADDLAKALAFLGPMGVTAEVFSGGQDPFGTGYRRTGSTRHDEGRAADVRFYRDGRQLNWADPNDLPTFTEIVQRGKQAGLTGFGAGPGYMPEGSMHIGYGKPGVWGAGGKGANAPEWLRTAYNTPMGNKMDPIKALINQGHSHLNDDIDKTVNNIGPVAQPRAGMSMGTSEAQRGGLGGFFDANRSALMGLGIDLMRRGLDTRKGFSGRNAMIGRLSDTRRRETEAKRQQAAEQRNMTADYIARTRPDLAEAVQAGVLSPSDAYKMAMDPGPEPTSGMREYSMAVEQGYPGSFIDFKRDTRAGTTVNVGPQGQTLAKPPAGYGIRRNADGSPYINPETQTVEFVQIPGGPAAVETEIAQAGAEKAQAAKEQTANIVIDDIDRAIMQIQDSPMTTGVGGAITQSIPGTPAFNVNALLDTVRANAGFDRLQAMRDASPTGGALGQVSNIELNLLQSAIGNLALAQSEDQLIENLQRVRQIYSDIIHGPTESIKGSGPEWQDMGDGIKVREISR